MIKKRMFTLIELIVVLSTILILINLIIPALNRVDEITKGMNCMNKQKQIGVYQASYLANNNSTYQPFKGNASNNWRSWREYIQMEIDGTYDVMATCTEQPCIWWCDAREWIPGWKTAAHCWRNIVYYGGNQHLENKRSSSMIRPSTTVFVVDSSFMWGRHYNNRWSNQLMNWTSWRHTGGTSNYLFIDGHVTPIEDIDVAEKDLWEMFDQSYNQ